MITLERLISDIKRFDSDIASMQRNKSDLIKKACNDKLKEVEGKIYIHKDTRVVISSLRFWCGNFRPNLKKIKKDGGLYLVENETYTTLEDFLKNAQEVKR